MSAVSIPDAATPQTTAIPWRSPRTRGAGLAAALFVVAALVLRLVGFKTGLPYVYNADENAHFVPRAIGMFGHGWNPGYFINPPAFTYVLHVLFAIRWAPTRRRSAARSRPTRPRRSRWPAPPPGSSAPSPSR